MALGFTYSKCLTIFGMTTQVLDFGGLCWGPVLSYTGSVTLDNELRDLESQDHSFVS